MALKNVVSINSDCRTAFVCNFMSDTSPFQFECSNEEKKKVQESMQKYEEEKLEVTRALQMKLDDKRAKIARYQGKLKELENNSGAIQ